MNSTIALLLVQDGLTNGLIYALLALAILLVFVVTRILFVPQGEFVVLGALTIGLLQQNKAPGTVWILGALAAAVVVSETWTALRSGNWRPWRWWVGFAIASTAMGILLTLWAPVMPDSLFLHVLVTVLLIVPMGPLLYRVAYHPIAGASILVLLFVSVAIHYVLIGVYLYVFGPEGFRTQAFIPGRIDAGFTRISWHLVLTLGISALMMLALWLFMERTLLGRALRATAINRLGARLVGIRTGRAGVAAFALTALLGALSGVLIGPITPTYYDSGFLIALKGFIGTVVGGLVSFPLGVVGAILVGLVESYASFFSSGYKEAIVFALIVPILLWRSAVERHHRAGEEDEE
jgi:branched-chain amino acid transport system permease protein